MSDAVDAAITAYLDSLHIEEWAPLTTAERDLLRRTVGRVDQEAEAPAESTDVA